MKLLVLPTHAKVTLPVTREVEDSRYVLFDLKFRKMNDFSSSVPKQLAKKHTICVEYMDYHWQQRKHISLQFVLDMTFTLSKIDLDFEMALSFEANFNVI